MGFDGISMGFGPFQWDFYGIWGLPMGFDGISMGFGPFLWDFGGIWEPSMGFWWDLGTFYGI